MKKSKKRILLTILLSFLLILLAIFIYTFFGLQSVSDEAEYVTVEIESGTKKFDIVNNLYDAGVIKSKNASSIYVLLNLGLNLQAGTYKLNRADSSIDIFNQIANGDTNIYEDIITITFLEGKRVTDYATVISEKFGYDYDEVMSVFEDRDFAKELIARYDILTDEIIDDKIYYPLEGYLFPDTYEFYKTASVKEIIEKMVSHTATKLGQVKSNIEASGYTLHEILTISSISEMEAVNIDDRKKVAQVVYTRLGIPMSLGMDVTSFYGVQKAMGEELTVSDLNDDNGYNTRPTSFLGLPIGPICNSSFDSVTAALNPAETSYVYFIADVNTGDVFFYETASEFEAKKNELY